MADEFKHVSVGPGMTQTEYEQVDGHILNSQATGDLIYAANATQLRRLGIGSTGQVLKVTGGVPTWSAGLVSKVKYETRILTAGSGNVSYTGYGFQPSALIIFGLVPNTVFATKGFSDSALGSLNIWYLSTTSSGVTAVLISILTGASDYQEGVLASYDADGFTLTWTKTGSPTGTLNMLVLALK